MRISIRPCIAALSLALCGVTRPALADDWLAECTIRFDNEFALTWVHANARATFAPHTGLSPSGSTEICNASHTACWTYRERCGSRAYVNIEESPRGRYNHFHLMFEDPALSTFPCFTDPDGRGSGVGRGTPAACTTAD